MCVWGDRSLLDVCVCRLRMTEARVGMWRMTPREAEVAMAGSAAADGP